MQINFTKKQSSRFKIFDIAFSEHTSDVNVGFEVASSLIIKQLVLKNMGIGFCETESIKDISDKIISIKEITFNENTQAIAVLEKNRQNAITKAFLKLLFSFSFNIFVLNANLLSASIDALLSKSSP